MKQHFRWGSRLDQEGAAARRMRQRLSVEEQLPYVSDRSRDHPEWLGHHTGATSPARSGGDSIRLDVKHEARWKRQSAGPELTLKACTHVGAGFTGPGPFHGIDNLTVPAEILGRWHGAQLARLLVTNSP